MNIMRKILSSQGSAASVSSPTENTQDEADAEDIAVADASEYGNVRSERQTHALRGATAPSPPPPPDSLSLSHLRKLLGDYRQPPHPLSEAEKEERLRSMLPLFCKV